MRGAIGETCPHLQASVAIPGGAKGVGAPKRHDLVSGYWNGCRSASAAIPPQDDR
jgi:hypothetical protein